MNTRIFLILLLFFTFAFSDDTAKCSENCLKCDLVNTPLTNTIISHESGGNYNVAIKQTASNPNKYGYITRTEASKWTIGQIKEKFAKGTYELQAIGKYQLINTTFHSFVAWAGFSDDTIFDKKAQDKFIDFTYIVNRKAIGKYLCCKSDDIELAARQIAMEWASVGVKQGTQRNKNCGLSKTVCGDSFYCRGDIALTCYSDIIEALKATRQQIQSGTCGQQQPDSNTTTPDNNSTSSGGNTGGYNDDIDDVNVGTNSGGGCGGCVSLPAIEASTKNSILNFKNMEANTAQAIDSIIEAIHYAHQQVEDDNKKLTIQTQKLLEQENLVEKELLFNKIRINKLQGLINTKKAEE